MLDLIKGLHNLDLGAAHLVVLDGVDEKALEGSFHVACKLEKRSLAGERRRAGHDQV